MRRRGLLAKILRTVGRQQEADEHNAIASAMAEQDNEYGQACFAAVTGNVDDDLIAEGDKVVVRWTMRGTHLGDWPAPWGSIPPTGKPVTVSAIHIFRIADGKIVERWAQVDILGMLQQIDALPAR